MTERSLTEGYLTKSPDNSRHLHTTKKWQRKWFTLDKRGNLSCYDHEKSTNMCGVMQPMTQCSLIFNPQSMGVPFSFCMGLDFRDSTQFFLKADSAQVFNDWLKLFRDFVERCELEDLSSEHHNTLLASKDSFQAKPGSMRSARFRHSSRASKLRFQRKEGFMSKTGSNNKGWKERYFILNGGKLSYYKNEKSIQSSTPLGIIDMNEVFSVTKSVGKKGFGFDLHMPSRVYNFSNEAAVEQTDWMIVLSHTLKVIADNKGSSTAEEDRTTIPDTDHVSILSDVSGCSDRVFDGEEEKVTNTDVTSVAAMSGKDGVVQLLEAEVEALHSKVSSFEADLRSSTSVNNQLQKQLVEERMERERNAKGLRLENQDFALQVEQLEKAKEELETVNDSIQTQLDEEQEKNQELEDDLVSLRQELEEQQAASGTMEEELSETQSKLLEIQEVAKRLEESLSRRVDSEPPMDPSSIRSLTLTYKAKIEKNLLHSPEPLDQDEDPIGGRVSNEMMALRDSVSFLEEEKRSLQQQMENLQSDSSDMAKKLVHEERLKWQVEMANIRREMEGKLADKKRGWESKMEALKQEVKMLREELSSSNGSTHKRVEQLQATLEQSHLRIVQLEGELKTASEKSVQLLTEKEKALADLKTIRKTNRSMEKQLVEERKKTSSPQTPIMSPLSMNSLSEDNTTPSLSTPWGTMKLMEVEERTGDLRRQLILVEKERDQLKAELEAMGAGGGTPSRDSGRGITSSYSHPFNFRNKTGAIVEMTRQSAGESAQSPPIYVGLTHDLACNLDSDLPPPKPKKPPKELVNRLNQPPSSPSHSTLPTRTSSLRGRTDTLEEDTPSTSSVRSRTASMLQVLFARR